MPRHRFIIALLLTAAFGVAAALDAYFLSRPDANAPDRDVLALMLGDGRKLLANHFFIKADAYFHSGYYPTIYDNNEAFRTPHMAEDAGALKSKNAGDENTFLGKPLDIIDRFGRSFFPSRHTHLDEGGAAGPAAGDLGQSQGGAVREILPWLSLSAALDPNNIETYTVTAYWLRNRMGKVREAEEFLRDGLRANPGSFAILFELGRIYDENRGDPVRARNLYEAALAAWRKQESSKKEPDVFLFLQVTGHLARLEERLGNFSQAIAYLEMLKSYSPNPTTIDNLIQQVKAKMLKAGPAQKSLR